MKNKATSGASSNFAENPMLGFLHLDYRESASFQTPTKL